MALKSRLHMHPANCVCVRWPHTHRINERDLKRNKNFNPHISHFYGNKSAAKV